MRNTAIRYGEARTLTWGDLDLDAGVMTLRAANTKAGRERQIPLAEGLVGDLAELRELHQRVLGRPVAASDRVFLTPEGCAWCVPSNNIARVLERLLAAAGIERVDAQGRKLDLHALRHTAATRPGDLWLLGRHRLLCGDSSSEADVDRLVAGAPIHLVNSDPPYNVRVEPRSNNAIAAGLSSFGPLHHQALDLARFPGKSKPTDAKLRAKDRPLENDFVTDEEFARMLRAWFGNFARVLLPGRGFYIWGGYANCANYPSALAESGLYFSQSIIWDKQHPVLTRKDFMGAHEWCFYGWKEGAAHQYLGPANATDLWAVKKVNPQSMVHLTEKPVELAARAIQYSSREGENVIDLFGGSGSTLCAAEQTGRNAYLMEIDPLYCDVIVERWQKLTGQEARLENGGESYAQRKAAAASPEVDDGPQAG